MDQEDDDQDGTQIAPRHDFIYLKSHILINVTHAAAAANEKIVGRGFLERTTRFDLFFFYGLFQNPVKFLPGPISHGNNSGIISPTGHNN